MQILENIKNAVITGKLDKIEELVKEALQLKVPVKQILNNSLIGGMQKVGEFFKKNEMFIPEVMISAKTMHVGLSAIESLLIGEGCAPKARIIMGTVKGDLHDIGKNLVIMMLKGAGFEVIDLGIDVPPEKFVNKLKETPAEIIAMSALITTSMPVMEKTISLLKENNLSVKTMVGGAPVTKSFADEIGADGYAPDAATAVDCAQQLFNKHESATNQT